MIEKTYIIKEMFRDEKFLINNYSRQTLCFLKREKIADIKEVIDACIYKEDDKI